MCDCLVEADGSFDKDIGFVAAVLVLLSGTVRESTAGVDVIEVDLVSFGSSDT